ncbi:phosphatase [Rhizobium sp. TH135]|uniref:metallophosphoesterase n=1 Tax=Rhizobium sp. TH135 TaxID=2067451 RepID=UPI000C79A92C|nr:metallophosphoesterase [Rhizobium sp. TH135]PLK71999.1 phosphatase [Rhizobium sp. TH135]
MTTDTPCLRLGIIADPQYADLDPNLVSDRYFRRSLDKLRAAVDHFNSQDLDAVLVLGDLIDRGWENFEPVLEILDGLEAPRILLPGNHDFLVEPDRLTDIHAALGMPAPYHEVELKGVRLLVTDGSEISLFAPPEGDERRAEAEKRLAELKEKGAPNAHHWNAGISDSQITWIAERLADAEASGEDVILLGHYPVYPSSDHTLWDAEELAALIAGSSSALAYLCGHHHVGNYAELNGVHFVNFCGMVDTEHENAFAVLSVFDDRIEIAGHGREPDRRLERTITKQR